MNVKIFTPIPSQNPIYLAGNNVYADVINKHGGMTLAEIKEDGYRLQIHKKNDAVKAFTRSMNEVDLDLFPELHKSLASLPNCVLDTEIVGRRLVGKDAFDSIKKRFRSKISSKKKQEYLSSDLVMEYPLELRVFDTLHWEGKDLLDCPLTERREYTLDIHESRITPSKQRAIKDHSILQNWFDDLVLKNYEGLVCKKPDSLYVPDSRTEEWVKLKRAETYDLVVMGVYMQEGRIGQILCGTANNGKYETLARVNSKEKGFDNILEEILEGNHDNPLPQYVINPALKDIHHPSYFVDPTVVVEVKTMDIQHARNVHSCGLQKGMAYSLRIGWLNQIREDKSVDQITTTQEIARIYAEKNK